MFPFGAFAYNRSTSYFAVDPNSNDDVAAYLDTFRFVTWFLIHPVFAPNTTPYIQFARLWGPRVLNDLGPGGRWEAHIHATRWMLARGVVRALFSADTQDLRDWNDLWWGWFGWGGLEILIPFPFVIYVSSSIVHLLSNLSSGQYYKFIK